MVEMFVNYVLYTVFPEVVIIHGELDQLAHIESMI